MELLITVMCRCPNEGPIRFDTAHVWHKKIRQTRTRKEQKARTNQVFPVTTNEEFQSTHGLATAGLAADTTWMGTSETAIHIGDLQFFMGNYSQA